MRKLALTIGGLAIIGGIAGTAGAAHADTVPVNATVVVNESLQVIGYPTTVAFGNALPGQTAHAPDYTFEIVTNHAQGTTQSIKNENGGFHTSVGQPDQIPNTALQITNGTGTHRLVSDGTTFLQTIPYGDRMMTDAYSLDIPSTAVGALNAQYTVSFVAV